jgi:hypothetical protein
MPSLIPLLEVEEYWIDMAITMKTPMVAEGLNKLNAYTSNRCA